MQIAMASNDDILEGTERSVEDALSSFPDGQIPEGALISACATRNWLLGSRTSAEVDIIRTGLGANVPIAGFYAFGEIAPLQLGSAPKFHNETCVIVLIGT